MYEGIFDGVAQLIGLLFVIAVVAIVLGIGGCSYGCYKIHNLNKQLEDQNHNGSKHSPGSGEWVRKAGGPYGERPIGS